jgi:hypothetical protein
MTREEMIQIYSDVHKDAYGFRPRYDWGGLTLDELKAEFNKFNEIIKENNKFEEAAEREAVENFKALIATTMKHGAADEKQAVQWLIQTEEIHNYQDIEAWIWEWGFLFTDYGRNLVKELIVYYWG